MYEDKKELGPLIPEIIALLGGILCVIIIALPLNTLLGSIFGIAPLIAPFVEEPCKVIGILYLALYYPSSLTNKKKGATLGVLAGIGFAFVENIVYLFQAPDAVLLRSVFPVLMHVCASATAGMGLVFLAHKDFDRSSLNLNIIVNNLKTKNLLTFVAIAMAFHFFYNFLSLIWILFIVGLVVVCYVFYKLYYYLPDDLSSMDDIGPVYLLKSALQSKDQKSIDHIISDVVGSKENASSNNGNNKNMFCGNCGLRIEDPSKFCPKCGSILK
ncbi:PrsW family glutamic-type intramembrane protease [Methanococcoides burtonii]|uniref:PrsW family glutamic-type intramembrane protease n=1 Tax=Methanococcoides burtonii TaxID=29291 RepID=UPI000039948E|nr:PrsW family glutamic-type intramembrane protease [Methanococcoides burtonii]